MRRRFAGRRVEGKPDDGRHCLIGSFRKGTALRPATVAGVTVDMLFVLPARLRPDASAAAGASATPAALPSLLDDVASVLAERYGGAAIDRGGWLCVRPATTMGPIAPLVRVKPCFACAGGYLIPPHGGKGSLGPWRHVRPEDERRSLQAADALTCGKAGHLILMLKAWRRARAVPLAPFALELLAVEFVRHWLYQRRSALFYDWMIRDFFFWLTAQAGRQLAVPGAEDSLQSGDAWRLHAEEAFAVAADASALERDNDEAEAVASWRQIFGPCFAMPGGRLLSPPAATSGCIPYRSDGRS